MVNLNECDQRLKKGDIIGKSELVIMVTTQSDKKKPNFESDSSQYLMYLVEKASSTLNKQEKLIFGCLFLIYKDGTKPIWKELIWLDITGELADQAEIQKNPIG